MKTKISIIPDGISILLINTKQINKKIQYQEGAYALNLINIFMLSMLQKITFFSFYMLQNQCVCNLACHINDYAYGII